MDQSEPIEAIYENGVLRPLVPMDLPEHERLFLMITSLSNKGPLDRLLDVECHAAAANKADSGVPLEEVRRRLAHISGSLAADVAAERNDR